MSIKLIRSVVRPHKVEDVAEDHRDRLEFGENTAIVGIRERGEQTISRPRGGALAVGRRGRAHSG